MKQNYTHISILLDRSGSMASAANDVRGGIKNYIDGQKNIDGECTISLYQFDDKFDIEVSMANIKDVNSEIKFTPRGMTALYDAIGRSIAHTGSQLSAMAEENRPEKVLFVIFTDGAENSSREYTHAMVQEIIKEQTEKYNWEFVYLGANQDGMAVGSGLGIKGANSITYDVNATSSLYSSLLTKTVAYRSGIAGDFAFTDEEREDAMKVSK